MESLARSVARERRPLDHRHFEPRFSGAYGRGGSRRAAPDNDDVGV